jgi:hypothetical protein
MIDVKLICRRTGTPPYQQIIGLQLGGQVVDIPHGSEVKVHAEAGSLTLVTLTVIARQVDFVNDTSL